MGFCRNDWSTNDGKFNYAFCMYSGAQFNLRWQCLNTIIASTYKISEEEVDLTYTIEDLANEFGGIMTGFFTDVGNFPNLNSDLTKVDIVDVFASQNFTLISEITRGIPNAEEASVATVFHPCCLT